MICNKRGNKAFTSLVILGLALGTFAPVGCVSLTKVPVNVVKGIGNGIGSGATFAKDKTVDFVSFIGRLAKNGTLGAFNIAKTGTVKTAALVKNGTVKTVDLAKTGVVKSATLVKDGTVKTIDLAKAGLGKMHLNKNQVKVVAAMAGVLAAFRFFMKEPSGAAIRFDKQTFLDSIKDKEIKEAFQQAWYFLDDVVIGRAGKRSSIRVTPDGKKLDVRPGFWPIGLGGYTHMYLPAATKALGFVIALNIFKKAMTDGKDAWKDFVGYSPANAVNALITE